MEGLEQGNDPLNSTGAWGLGWGPGAIRMKEEVSPQCREVGRDFMKGLDWASVNWESASPFLMGLLSGYKCKH